MILYEEKAYHSCDHNRMFSLAEYDYEETCNREYLPEPFTCRNGLFWIYEGDKKRHVCRAYLRIVY